MPKSQRPRHRHKRRKTMEQDLHRPPHIHQCYRTFRYMCFDTIPEFVEIAAKVTV